MKFLILTLIILISNLSALNAQPIKSDSKKNKYDFLNKFDAPPPKNPIEQPLFGRSRSEQLDIDLTSYYGSFREGKVVNIYYGGGFENDFSYQNPDQFFAMLQALVKAESLKVSKWNLDKERYEISFQNDATGVTYIIKLGNERDEFQKAFSNYQIVMYHGHSRYGRGPTFRSYWNYFRMGSIFNVIEETADNPYFLNEPIQNVAKYPVQSVAIGGKNYDYQYRGQLLDSSYLPSDTYTKQIPGYDTDLKKTVFLPSPQLIWLYSCSNADYFKIPLRTLFPNEQDRFIFGTSDVGYGSEKPAAVFIVSILKEQIHSDVIVKSLNDVGDCNHCFTSY